MKVLKHYKKVQFLAVGKVRIGWVICYLRIELIFGHLAKECTSGIGRSDRCRRCRRKHMMPRSGPSNTLYMKERRDRITGILREVINQTYANLAQLITSICPILAKLGDVNIFREEGSDIIIDLTFLTLRWRVIYQQRLRVHDQQGNTKTKSKE